MSLPPVLRGPRAAFIFMTRLRVGGFPYSNDDFRWASAYFPLVGLVVGILGSLALLAAHPLGPHVSALFAVIVTIWATGAFHEDGLADTMDALGGSHSKKKLHDILRDSRIGTYGGSALVCSLLLRVLLLAALPSDPVFSLAAGLTAPIALILVHVLSRTGPVLLMATQDYAAPEGSKGASVASGEHRTQAFVASTFSGSLLVLLGVSGLSWVALAALIGTLILVTTLLGRVWEQRAGGFTGDFLGATEQFLEMSLLGVLVVASKATQGALNWPAWF